MSRRSLSSCLLAAVLAGGLGACASDRNTTGSVYPNDVRARHPIVLTDQPQVLDVFPTGAGFLDPRQATDVDAFLLDYRRYGRGGLLIESPQGLPPATAAAVARTVDTVRLRAVERGVPAAAVALSPYPVRDPVAASAVRMSFQRMQAKVAGACGLWPQDLAEGDAGFNARNEPYWNLGCANQANVAAQIDDPIDLVRARTEGRIDTIRRTKDILQMREGKDPSTQWNQDGKTSVKSQVSQ
jgi:pilus assembly protein CpaD